MLTPKNHFGMSLHPSCSTMYVQANVHFQKILFSPSGKVSNNYIPRVWVGLVIANLKETCVANLEFPEGLEGQTKTPLFFYGKVGGGLAWLVFCQLGFLAVQSLFLLNGGNKL